MREKPATQKKNQHRAHQPENAGSFVSIHFPFLELAAGISTVSSDEVFSDRNRRSSSLMVVAPRQASKPLWQAWNPPSFCGISFESIFVVL